MNVLLSVVLLVITLFTAWTKPPRIQGKYQVYRVYHSEVTPSDKYVIFHNNGKLEGGRMGDNPNKNGNWKFNRKKQVLHIRSNTNHSDNGKYKVYQFSDSAFFITKGRDTFQLRILGA